VALEVNKDYVFKNAGKSGEEDGFDGQTVKVVAYHDDKLTTTLFGEGMYEFHGTKKDGEYSYGLALEKELSEV
jgi:hypothetical protein